MNFEQLQYAEQNFDEIMALGRDVEKEGKLYHIIGMTRLKNKAKMYVLEREDEAASEKKDCAGTRQNNRMHLKKIPEESYFSYMEMLKVGEQELAAESASMYTLGCGDLCEKILFFSRMKKAGWKLKPEHAFFGLDWDSLLLTEITLRMKEEQLPDWDGKEIFVMLSNVTRKHYVELPLSLIVGQEQAIDFSLKDGRRGICYINKVYPIDIWQELEERYKDARYLEVMTAEKLEEQKKAFFQGLTKDCPKGMYYLGIEYECTLEGGLIFYDRKFLQSGPKMHKGGSNLLMMLKPEEPIGTHGLPRRGCVIQTPVEADVQRMDAELFLFYEMLQGREDRL